jgi:hypothetical protein
MAISATLIEEQVVAATSVTSAGVTPTDGVLYIFGSVSSSAGGSSPVAALSTSGAATLANLGTTPWGSRRSSGVWRVTGWGSGDTFTVTNSGSNDQSAGIIIVQATGLDSTPDSDYASANEDTGSSNSASVAVGGTPGAGDATLSFVVQENNEAFTTEAGWAELADSGEANGVRRMGAAWDDAADTACLFSWTSNGAYFVASLILHVSSAPPGPSTTVLRGLVRSALRLA